MTGPAKILAVDDEADFELLIRQQFRHQIRAQEYDFSFARHGEEALAVLAKDPEIELMLLDIGLPKMNGYELIKKAKEIDKQVKVVLMSAFEINNEEFHNMLSDIKVDGFLQKPFSMWKLNDVIEKIALGIDCVFV